MPAHPNWLVKAELREEQGERVLAIEIRVRAPGDIRATRNMLFALLDQIDAAAARAGIEPPE